MPPTKYFLDSTTVRGALLAFMPTVVAVLNLFGVQIASEETMQIVDGIAGLVGAAGLVVTIYGRITARAEIVFKS